ncbi:MAG: hypothetical protein GY773_07800 [Actinomycetia bacterium]|nr:hypothetical protein [Actinomycetes bacterium]
MTPSPEVVSQAIVDWTGHGRSAWPDRDPDRITQRWGPEAAAYLVPWLTRLEDDFYRSTACHTSEDLVEMGKAASAEFAERHPEISAKAVEALAWCYTFDFK